MEILLLVLLAGGLLLASGKKQRVIMIIGDKDVPVSAGDVVSILFLVEPGMADPALRAGIETSFKMLTGAVTVNSFEWRPDGGAFLLVVTYLNSTVIKVGSSMIVGKYRLTLSNAEKAPK